MKYRGNIPVEKAGMFQASIKMRRTVVLTILLVCGSVLLFGQDVILYNTNIVDVEAGKIVPGMTVYVKDGIIEKIA